MACQHPPEERQRVYEGGERPRADRMLCGLCGELLYLRASRPESYPLVDVSAGSRRARESG